MKSFRTDGRLTSLALHVHSHLAEASPGLWVADAWCCPLSAAVARDALREVVEPGTTSVALPPCDSGLASAPKAKEAKVLVSYRWFQSPLTLQQTSCCTKSVKQTHCLPAGC